MMQIKRVKTKQELENAIEDKVAEGYLLDSKTDRQAVLIKRTFGKAIWHILLALLTIWWTFGIGNAIYLMFAYFCRADKLELKLE